MESIPALLGAITPMLTWLPTASECDSAREMPYAEVVKALSQLVVPLLDSSG